MKPFPVLCKLCLKKKYVCTVQESMALSPVPFDISCTMKQLICALHANHLGKCVNFARWVWYSHFRPAIQNWDIFSYLFILRESSI